MATIKIFGLAWSRLNRRRLIAAALVFLVAWSAVWWFWPTYPSLPILARWPLPGGQGWPLGFSPDGTLFATSCQGHDILIWDIKTRAIRMRVPTKGAAIFGDFSPDGRTFVANCYELGKPRDVLIDVIDGTIKAEINLDDSSPLESSFSRDSKQFFVLTVPDSSISSPTETSSWSLRSWSTTDWVERKPRSINLSVKAAFAIDLLSDNQRLISTQSGKPGVDLWDVGEDPPYRRHLENASGPQSEVLVRLLSHDESMLFLSKADGSIDVCKLPSLRFEESIPAFRLGFLSRQMKLTRDKRTLVTVESEFLPDHSLAIKAREIFRWLSYGGRYREMPTYLVVRKIEPFRAVRAAMQGQYRPCLSSDGKVLASVSEDGTLTLWKLSGP